MSKGKKPAVKAAPKPKSIADLRKLAKEKKKK